jgi:signal transduction histidine kinase
MTQTLAKKVIVPMAAIVMVAAVLVSSTLTWFQVRHQTADARNELDGAEAHLLDVLNLVHDQLASKMGAEMRVLQAEARRMGVASQAVAGRGGAGETPDLRFGGQSQALLMARVEPVTLTAEGTCSIFSQGAQGLVRVSTSSFLPNGTRALGSAMDPSSAAFRTLEKGRAYWGPADLFGSRHYAYYEPIRDAAGTMVGAFGIEVPLARLRQVHAAFRRIQVMDHGFAALIGPDGRPLFAGGALAPEDTMAVFRDGRAHDEAWSVRRIGFGPWGVTLMTAFPQRDLEVAVWLIRLGTMGIALLLVGALTWSYYYVLRKNLLQPLGDVLDVLDCIASLERFEVRFQPRPEREMGALTRSLNGMLDQIQVRDRKLLDHQEHLEELVAERLDQLRETQQLLSSTLDALPAAIAILDGSGTLLLANRQWSLMTDSAHPLLAKAEVGTAYLPLCAALQADPGELGEAARQVADVIQDRRGSASLDCAWDGDQGRQWFTVLATRFTARGLPRIAVMYLDVTEKRTMEVQLRQAQKLESIGQLAAGIAHEINTPTQYIGDNIIFLRGAFEDLWRLLETIRPGAGGTELPASVRRAVEEADLDYLEKEIPNAIGQSLEGVRRVSSIVSAMKDFSHPGASAKTPTDLNRAIESTALVCRSEWKYVGEMQLDLAPDLPLVPCLPDEFNQVVLNLIINAAHAIAEAGRNGKGLIRIQTRPAGEFAQISISDNGAGIPEAIQSRVFDPFFTTKPVGKGTGQGLAIAHSVIVEQHGGSIALESAVGGGTTFHLRLPVASAGTPRRPDRPGPQERP